MLFLRNSILYRFVLLSVLLFILSKSLRLCNFAVIYSFDLYFVAIMPVSTYIITQQQCFRPPFFISISDFETKKCTYHIYINYVYIYIYISVRVYFCVRNFKSYRIMYSIQDNFLIPFLFMKQTLFFPL